MKTIFWEHRPAIQRDFQIQLENLTQVEISLRCKLADTDILIKYIWLQLDFRFSNRVMSVYNIIST